MGKICSAGIFQFMGLIGRYYNKVISPHRESIISKSYYSFARQDIVKFGKVFMLMKK